MKKIFLKIKLNNIFFIITMMLPVICFAKNDKNFESFLKLFNKDYEPTLSDYKKYFHNDGTIDWESKEEPFEIMAFCQKKKYSTVSGYWEDFKKFQHARRSKPSKEPSYYIAWLRSKLPLSPIVKIEDVKMDTLKTEDGKYTCRNKVYFCKFNGSDVVISCCFMCGQECTPVVIESINGRDLYDLFKNDVDKGFDKLKEKSESVLPSQFELIFPITVFGYGVRDNRFMSKFVVG